MRRKIRLTESEFRRIISETIKKVIREQEQNVSDEDLIDDYYNQFPGLDDNPTWRDMDSDMDWDDLEHKDKMGFRAQDANAIMATKGLQNFTNDNSKRYDHYVNYLDRDHIQNGEKSIWDKNNIKEKKLRLNRNRRHI